MRKILIATLAGIMLASMSFAATGPGRETVNKEAERVSKEIKQMSGAQKEAKLIALVKNNKMSDSEATQVYKALETVYKGKEDMLVDSIALFSKARESADADVTLTMSKLDELLITVGKANVKEDYINDTISPLVGSAKLAVTQMDKDSSSKVRAELNMRRRVLEYNANPKVAEKLNEEQAELLILNNYVEGNKSFKDYKSMEAELGADAIAKLKERNENKKKNCREAI